MKGVISKLLNVSPLTWAALGIALAAAAAAAVLLWHLRGDAVDVQARELGLLSLALTDDLDRGLRGAEAGLGAISEELREHPATLLGADAAEALQTRAQLMPLVQTLWLVDHTGRVLSASAEAPPPDLQSFQPALGRLADRTLAVSRPFIEPGAKQSVVALAYRFTGPQGATDGWILAALPAPALLGAFSAASPASDARMAVFRDDGVRLAGSIVANPRLDEATVAQRLAVMRGMEVRKFHDGSERLVSFHALQRYGLSVVLTRDLPAVLAPWQQAAGVAAAGTVILLAILVASVHLVQRADRRRLEAQRALHAQRARASKLESLGTLAGGVAHDFNNLLASIIGFGELAQDSAPPGSDQARQLDKVMRAALRGKALSERILAFSRGGARTSTVFELEAVVSEVLTLLSGSLRPGIVLERALDAAGGNVRGDPTQAFEAIMNLCTNAMQAMPEGGTVSVGLARAHVAATRVLSHSRLGAGDYLALSISDQGKGISTAVMERLFEPFFTTRGDQSGTGLGLAVVHGVIAEFGGAIDVQSKPGQGARFTLYFPETAAALGAPAPPPVLAPRGAGQALLVVDDEPALVALAQEMLEGLGYQPIGFSDSVEALHAVRAQPERFAAVITDEVMPRLNGTQFTEQLRAVAPSVPVLLVSGYGGALLAARAAAVGVTRVLAKPLQRVDLARALADLLR
ncbi:MAG TPA: ATP-binding protein [Burkholderiaceae bacterium]|nr:ATP-binding protein [Burkholderiaceae bacterium]